MKIKIKRFRSVKSTNDIAIKMIKKNIFEPTIIFSEQQTRGRGTGLLPAFNPALFEAVV